MFTNMVAARSALLYRSNCWIANSNVEHKLSGIKNTQLDVPNNERWRTKYSYIQDNKLDVDSSHITDKNEKD